MSKSLGNVIEPDKIIKTSGADVLRLWVSSVDYSDDTRLSETVLQRTTDAYRKFRNTFRYALGNLAGFDPERDSLPTDELLDIDRWILYEMRKVVEDCRSFYDAFAFHRIYRRVYDFTTTDLSALYFDVVKDRLYTSAPDSKLRRSAQTALYRVSYALVRLLAPILSFTCEEVWGQMTRPSGSPHSVHLSDFPAPEELIDAEPVNLEFEWDILRKLRADVLNALEAARQAKQIGSGLEAQVFLGLSEEQRASIAMYTPLLADLFIVSQVHITDEAGRIEIKAADGIKCERCWKYTTDVGSDPAFPTACARCAAAVREMFGS